MLYDADENVIGGTFTLLRFKYGWDGQVEYTLDLPIYIQQRLKVDTHTAITADIQYQTDVLKAGESHKVSEARTVLVTGESYSIYSEYIYNEIPTSLKETRLPKILEIATGHKVFEKGTKLTMFSLMENSEPYYYEVTNSNGVKKIDMADFKNSNGENYEIKNLGYLVENNTKSSYTDIHNGKYNNSVVVEQFVVLVDTSNAQRVGERQIYGLYFSGKDIQKTGNIYTDLQVSNRLDYNEDCNVNIMEVPGFNFEIDEEGKKSDGSYATKIGTSSYIGDTGKVDVDLQYQLEIDIAYLTRGYATRQNEIKRYVDVEYSLAVKDGSDIPVNISLPKGMKMTFRDDEEDIVYITEEEKDVFYYYKESKKQDELCINDLSVSDLDMETGRDRSVGIGTFQTDVTLDFSSVDNTIFDKYSKDAEFYIVANLVTYTETGMPEAGLIKDNWSGNVMLEVESEIGISVTVEDTEKLGMNRYQPTDSDDGVINCITKISFPESYGDHNSGLSDSAANNYYTIVYELQEKTVGDDGKTVYTTYTGDDITIYPGRLDWEDVNVVTVEKPILSKSGIQALTYQFTPEQIEEGVDLIDGIGKEETDHQSNAIIATHCTIMVNPQSDINMTNYRVNAYLIISEDMPDIIEHEYANAMMKGYTLREISQEGSNLIEIEELRNDFEIVSDYIVFTVAKVKVFD